METSATEIESRPAAVEARTAGRAGTTGTADRRRDLQSILGDGLTYNVMVGIGETYLPAFALALGLGEVVAGLMATLPMLAGAAMQLATPWAIRRVGSHRIWVVGCACAQAVSFLPLMAIALAGHVP